MHIFSLVYKAHAIHNLIMQFLSGRLKVGRSWQLTEQAPESALCTRCEGLLHSKWVTIILWFVLWNNSWFFQRSHVLLHVRHCPFICDITCCMTDNVIMHLTFSCNKWHSPVCSHFSLQRQPCTHCSDFKYIEMPIPQVILCNSAFLVAKVLFNKATRGICHSLKEKILASD